MEIDITDFYNGEDAGNFSASRAELGQDAGRITWRNALAEAESSPLLATEEQLEALRNDAKESGGWTRTEIAAWSDSECNALFVQMVSAQMREIEKLCTLDNGDTDWPAYEALCERGTVSGSLYRGDNGRIYYYLGI
jgi:hypothetical protein